MYPSGYAMDLARSFTSPHQLMRLAKDGIEKDLKVHLDESHPGWTVQELKKMATGHIPRE